MSWPPSTRLTYTPSQNLRTADTGLLGWIVVHLSKMSQFLPVQTTMQPRSFQTKIGRAAFLNFYVLGIQKIFTHL